MDHEVPALPNRPVRAGNPKALEFLRMDCTNVLNFFQKSNVIVPAVRRLFEFVVNPELPDSRVDAAFSDVSAIQVACCVVLCCVVLCCVVLCWRIA